MTDDASAAVPEAVGRRVRAARTARGWTLDALAEASGVSRRTVVHVEAGSSNASIETLLRLARALDVTLADLVSDASGPAGISVSAPGERNPLWRGASGGTAVLVASADTPDMLELWEWTLGPLEAYDSEQHRAGTRELLHVHAGRVRVTVDGETRDLPAGSAASFRGDVPHGYANPGRRPARFSLTVFEPRASVRP